MTKWEYMIIHVEKIAADMEQELDVWGLQGWELVSVDSGRAYVKRQILT